MDPGLPSGHEVALVRVLLGAHDRAHRQLAVAQRFEIVHALPDNGRVFRDDKFGRISLDLECLPGAALALSAARQNAPAESQEDDRDQREGGADGREVEELKRLADDFGANGRYEQVRRGADLGNATADQRAESERHQVN